MTTPLGMRTGALSAFAITLLGAGCGGVVSQETYFARLAKVDEENESRRDTALESLRAKGYVILERGDVSVTLQEQYRSRCAGALWGFDKPLNPDDTMQVIWWEGKDQPKQVPMSAIAACDFFSGRTEHLDRLLPDGGNLQMVRVPADGAAVRDPKGQVTLVAFKTKKLSKEDIKVEMSCNLMPSPRPTMLEDNSNLYLVPATAPTPHLELEVDVKYLNMTCTDQSS